ncbi:MULTISPECIES: hypothetical protein [Pseudomonas]|uniref:hypothetical protein n=1 Tax=Pseudomonas TaxID=286 RepID=UPI00062B06DF|nr:MULTISPECIES: hypothetical protein [Pseudomonas]KKX57954.1 hypothetical protein PU99_28360 [Pseudomonas putida]MCK8655403.1 hypothetical protein [Pseudomonas umsongensis]NBB59731.1 hypothetical protein [Pseudomonas sp. ODNR1LW]OMQ38915.1 hypothetical protein BKX96_06760 [Pseudomonas putida]
MSTLNEIAANHARMAKAKEQESTGLSERQLHIVGSFEIVTPAEQPHVPLHLVAAAQDNNLVQTSAFIA